MKFSDLYRFSIDNLRRRKGRTVLTVIGVVVGVCAIVVMISLGIAVNRATDQMLQSWGDLTKITVFSFNAQAGTPDLDDKMLEQFRTLPHVAAVTPMYTPQDLMSGEISAGSNGRYKSWPQIVGMDPEAMPAMGYKLLAGSYGIGQALGKDKIPVLVGDMCLFSFYDSKKSDRSPDRYKSMQWDENYINILNLPQYDENGVLQNPDEFFFDPMTTKIYYNLVYGYDDNGEAQTKQYELVPVGIVSAGQQDWAVSNGLVMSMDDVRELEAEYKRLSKSGGGGGGGTVYYSSGMMGEGDTVQVGGYENVYIKVDLVENMPDVETTIKQAGYYINSMSEVRGQMQGQVAQTQMMLGGLAAISLLVAALNIMNTMTMAIYERTKEIGVMKVLGCKLRDIRHTFLIESGAIGLIGGVVGVVLSLLLSALLNYLPIILMMLGVEGTVDIAGFFGLSGLQEMMGGQEMQLSVIPVWLVVLALAFATVVGILSGIAPANRAVKISSLEAIRHE